MLEFKKWILSEIVELKKPTNSVKKRNFIKNPGTNRPTQSIEYKFKTKLGNEVRIHFDVKGDDEYRVIFYVNNTLFDNASKKSGMDRDPEILAGVFHTVKEKANRLGAKILTFEAFKGENDDKIVKNINLQPLKEKALYDLNILYNSILNHKVTMIEPNEMQINLLKQLGRNIQAKPDIDVEKSLKEIKEIINIISNINNENKFEELYELRNFVEKTIYGIKHENSEPIKLSLNNLINGIISYSENGLIIQKNRRKNIYEKLIQRYFLDDWNCEIHYNHFTLTRKKDAGI